MSATAITATVWEDSDVTFLARVYVDNSSTLTAMVQADVSAITYAVFDQTGTAVAGGTGTVTVATSVFNTLQTGTIWTVDATGFNFKHKIGKAAFPGGSTSYRVEYKVVLASGDQGWIVFDVKTREVFTT